MYIQRGQPTLLLFCWTPFVNYQGNADAVRLVRVRERKRHYPDSGDCLLHLRLGELVMPCVANLALL